jgi:hypothetical protein
MSRRKKWLIAAALCLLGLLACLFFAAPRQPHYQGRSLSSWLADLSSSHYETQRVARAAIQAMGPEAVPYLTNSLAQRDSISLRAYRRNIIPRRVATWSHRYFKWQTPVMESRSAALALQTLGPQATNAIPALMAALQDPSWMVTQAAATALGAMGSNAVPALGERLTNGTSGELPWVLQAIALTGTNAAALAPKLAEMTTAQPGAGAIAESAAYALARIGAGAIAAITNGLLTTNVATQLRLLNALRQIGPPAIAATNQLFELTQSVNPTIRLNARYVMGATYAPRELTAKYWAAGLRDSDSTNVEVSLRFLTVYPANVRAYNREIAELARHPTNSIALMASNALTTFRAWPK